MTTSYPIHVEEAAIDPISSCSVSNATEASLMDAIVRSMGKRLASIVAMAKKSMKVQEAIHRLPSPSNVQEPPKKDPAAETEPPILADDAICIHRKN
jgi:hypothetical protein